MVPCGRRPRRWCSSGACGSRCCARSATSAWRSPTGSIEAYERVVDEVDLDVDRGAGAGHPPRRQGAHRGVLRARRPRAHPQGDDVPGPDRERRAAADPSALSSSATGASPRWRCWPSAAAEHADTCGHRPQPQRAGAGDHARQAVRERRRGAAGRRRAGRGPARALPAARASRGRSAPSRTSSICSATTPSTRSSDGSPEHLGFRHADNVGQVYPRSLDLDVVAALVQVAAGPSSLATTLRLMAGHELVTEGFRRARSARRRCRTR
jgi:hypothetical protein